MDKAQQPDSGGPAFPHPDYLDVGPTGMFLRDYFAAKAMPVVAGGSYLAGKDFLHPDQYDSVAFDAYRLADAMLKARALSSSPASRQTGGADK